MTLILKQAMESQLRVAAQRAVIEGAVDADNHASLLQLLGDHQPPGTWGMKAYQLNLLGKRLVGVSGFECREWFSAQSWATPVQSVLLYVPDDPLQALTQHKSWADAYTALSKRFDTPGYAAFFQRFVRQRDRVQFAASYVRQQKAGTDGVPIELDGRHFGYASDWLTAQVRSRRETIFDDALQMAVSTDVEDHNLRQQRLQALEEAGLDLANLLGLFVPGVGEAMLGVAAAQLLGEVFHGHEAWQQGDREGALNHLCNVAQNLAANAVLAGGGWALGKVWQRSAFVDEMLPVRLADGQQRLGNAPPLENPADWPDGLGLLRRFAGEWQLASDRQLQQVMEVTGTTYAQLRRWHVHDLAVPALMHDARLRLALDEQLNAAIAQCLSGEAGTPCAQLQGTRQASFEFLYNGQQAPLEEGARVLSRQFPGLPASVVQELIAYGEPAQLERLNNQGRVPLAMAEQARCMLEALRVNRAVQGFFLDNPAAADTRQLAQALLPHLPGWPVGLGFTGSGSYRQGKDYFLELAAALSADQQQAMALDASDPAADLRARLAALAVARRAQALELLGVPRPARVFNAPQRLADVRLGYPLSPGFSAGNRAAYRAVRELYPSFSETEVNEFLAEVRTGGRDFWTVVGELQQALGELNEVLYAWRTAPGASQPLRSANRARVATLLRQCWRRQSLRLRNRGFDYRLRLVDEDIGQLPTLPDSVQFNHVQELILNRLGLHSIADGFLRSFPNLRWLDVVNNSLTHVPAELTHLQQLTWLNLRHNNVAWRPADNTLLAALPRLEVLDLEHNPIRRNLDVAGVPRLRILRVRNTQMVAVPGGLLSRPLLESADLRDNPIVVLHEGLFNAPRRVLERINFHDNPLDAVSRQRLLDFERANRLPALAGYSHARFDQLRENWLIGTPAEQLPALSQRWDAVQAEPGAHALFRMLGDLRQTADYQRHATELRRRVWAVLEACEQNSELRQELFALAAQPRSCADSVAFNFSALEIRTFVATAVVGIMPQGREAALLKVARALFRLDEVDRLTRVQIVAREAEDEAVDEIEVALAYRSGLAADLDLPGQPRSMQYRFSADVSAADLKRMRAEVLAREATPQLAESIASRDFWVAHLKETFADQLEALNQPFYLRMEQLMSRESDMSDLSYMHGMNDIGTAQEQAQKAWVLQQTLQALQR
ncbi:NEL-type E3 ubiquitin ligase domain-containing protein [Pseudomonas rubra]|uniref:RING-type E3 ubiquitin transferase n=1 Tax=Pseudomonas rubra TaxID=2942627 RepID=A0ABT5PEY2_9PSED|nr:NEL-type E3 ubiquitin ligase domain-containing protein [Pseudomonas rubra]MDD1016746.1 hypothetical protein [Pseudomonas rubra]MDD1038721.1 hypothetical protein [Pseudomonas rubra]MDD1157228.1 hypothetical protein [Pseudomonas rubra]